MNNPPRSLRSLQVFAHPLLNQSVHSHDDGGSGAYQLIRKTLVYSRFAELHVTRRSFPTDRFDSRRIDVFMRLIHIGFRRTSTEVQTFSTSELDDRSAI